MLRFSQLKNITNGTVVSLAEDKPVTDLIIDSRKAIVREGSVFFAIAGDHHDGHNYISALYNSGIRQFVVEKKYESKNIPEANILKVDSCIDALQKISAEHRSKFSLPVIGIAGSNGKTIIKEWLYQLLANDYTIVKNPGSYN